MKGVFTESTKKANQMLKRIQHDMTGWFQSFVIPNLVRDLGFGYKAPPCERGDRSLFL
jgi:hypothetical protein